MSRARMNSISDEDVDSTRASRAGHVFHERWAARRALQLVFPRDRLFAIAVEGISTTETAHPGVQAEQIADLVLYYGQGNNFETCDSLETIQFKYKVREEKVTASYLKKTICKFADTMVGYEKTFPEGVVSEKLSFSFVTNVDFETNLWSALGAIVDGSEPGNQSAATQARFLRKWCADHGLDDAKRLFSRIDFRAGTKNLGAQTNALRRTLTDWSAGADSEARLRIFALQELIMRKAGPGGQVNNLIHREDVLDALDCEPEELFPADTRFVDVGAVIERRELEVATSVLSSSDRPVFLHADGGVGKTVFVQSLASSLAGKFEVVVFDCFGGGSYRSDSLARHLPRIGLVQIANELAARGLCDPLLPNGGDSQKIIKAARKRLAQAAASIRRQSSKAGLVIVVDAADNAQLEAEHRHEPAFPNLLLATMDEDPLDGVKLLMTARTHRRASVIGRARPSEIELGPFDEAEAREFLKTRRPQAEEAEIGVALTRSGRNARVLDYLLETWETNVRGNSSDVTINVPEIIKQRCAKITNDLYVLGWPEREVVEFFVALSLLPPPIPLEELGIALGWSGAQVRTAAADLAPMLEITSHGAIFRDEPTETFVREAYAPESSAQQAIAERLLNSQAASSYAAEALPHFLVIIKDSNRAFALADSANFPTAVQSEFGRRRLTLVRLRAAFRLAVSGEDFDRALNLSMKLAHAAMANQRGDEFIRESPALAIVLGDADSYRRLFADRSGWRGARSARLTVAHQFAGNSDEATIQCESTLRWINWSAEQPPAEDRNRSSRPSVADYAAALFLRVVEGNLTVVDKNLANWSDRFSLAVSKRLVELLELHDSTRGTDLLPQAVSFAASELCTSVAFKLRLLSCHKGMERRQLRTLAKTSGISASAAGAVEKSPEPEREESGVSAAIAQAALTVLLHSSRANAAAIMRRASVRRPTVYDYGEQHGISRAWSPILCACLRAWAAGKRVAYHDLLPSDVSLTKAIKAASTRNSLQKLLEQLPDTRTDERHKRRKKPKFTREQCEDICSGMDVVRSLMGSVETAVLSGEGLSAAGLDKFIGEWRKLLPNGARASYANARDVLARTIGIGCVSIFLDHSSDISANQVASLLELISTKKFFIPQKTSVLRQLASRPMFQAQAGGFAQHIASHIREDDDIEQRGKSYLGLARCLVPMGQGEARHYYRQGLAQLDQMGGESYEQIYSLLHFAGSQRGGYLKPKAAQRLMNLCQTIVRNDEGKFGWTLFARSAAQSIGINAVAKLVRWHDQDVADLSYGLPQLACFLARSRALDPRRAAFVLTILEEHGSWDWRLGDGIAELLSLSDPADQRRIVSAMMAKLRREHPQGGWPSLWESVRQIFDRYPHAITAEETRELDRLQSVAKRNHDEIDSLDSSSSRFLGKRPAKRSRKSIEDLITTEVSSCDPASTTEFDLALDKLIGDKLPHDAWRRFVSEVRSACPYAKRLAYMTVVCDSTKLNLFQALDELSECVAIWGSTSAHLLSERQMLVQRLFERKSADLFGRQHSDISRVIGQLATFCGDTRLVLLLVLRKVTAEEVEFDGDDWLQLATSLCSVASDQAGVEALSWLLEGPASRIADEIGEGEFRPQFAVSGSEADCFVDLIWHLLGSDDAYVRWNVARSLSVLVELGLTADLGLLLERLDRREVAYFVTPDLRLSFQNSRQWLLMGLARACLHHGQALDQFRPRLVSLAERDDLHVIHRVHIARCLAHIGAGDRDDAALEAVRSRIYDSPHGIVERKAYPRNSPATSAFRFDREITKYDVGSVARLFNLSEGAVQDRMAAEIMRLWPDATSLNDLGGHERYRSDSDDRYEYFREHVQRHALLDAATKLFKEKPIVVGRHEATGDFPWREWLQQYDITFDDGSWLADRKDPIPSPGRERFLGNKVKGVETFQSLPLLLRKLGIEDASSGAMLPLYGRWYSPDRVSVKITTALVQRKGAVGRCETFSKRANFDLDLPEFWEAGHYDSKAHRESPFAPLVWAPQIYRLGVDEGDEIAAEGPATRPRLGINITNELGLVNEAIEREWRTADGVLALLSDVWGGWKPNPDDSRFRERQDGEILWGSRPWLSAALSALNQRLVMNVTLWKHRSYRGYEPSKGVKLVLIGLRSDDGAMRFWPARDGSKVTD